MLTVVLSVCCGIILLYWKLATSKYRKLVNQFPGPKPFPYPIGNLLEWNHGPEKLFKIVRQYNKDFKSTYRLWACWYGVINMNTPEDVEIILSSTKQLKKSIVYNCLHPWLGTGLLTSEGNKWQTRRKILTPAFHFSILRGFVDIFGEYSAKLVKDLKEECSKDKTNVVPIITKCTLSIICETAMGTNLNSTGESGDAYRRAIHEFSEILVWRSFRPYLYNSYVFSLCSAGTKAKKHLKVLHDFTTKIIREREKNFKPSDIENLENDEECFKSKKRLAMLDLLIDAKHKGQIDDEGIREEVDTFMFEGHDTTSMALCFCLMNLANHKDVQEKIYQECAEMFGDSKRPANYQDLQNMKYLEMCIKESLRLYPSVPFISRYTTDKVKLTQGTAPAEVGMNVHIYDLHRNADIFPDPEKFDPDRFLPENVQGRHPFSYVPFSAGPRNCIGQRFAMLEMKSVISSIVRNYILEPIDTPATMTLIIDVVLRNKNGITVKFIERTSKRCL